MTPELTALALAGLIHVAWFAAYSVMGNIDAGPGFTTSPRDRPPSRPIRTETARLGRAYDNSAAMIGLFASAVVVVAISGQSTPITATLAFAYVALRALYPLAYLRGWHPWRSYIWLGTLTCCTLLFVAALIP